MLNELNLEIEALILAKEIKSDTIVLIKYSEKL